MPVLSGLIAHNSPNDEIGLVVRFDELSDEFTSTIPGFHERLRSAIPSLFDSRSPTAFAKHFESGITLPNVFLHVVTEIQKLLGSRHYSSSIQKSPEPDIFQMTFSGEFARQAIPLGFDLMVGALGNQNASLLRRVQLLTLATNDKQEDEILHKLDVEFSFREILHSKNPRRVDIEYDCFSLSNNKRILVSPQFSKEIQALLDRDIMDLRFFHEFKRSFEKLSFKESKYRSIAPFLCLLVESAPPRPIAFRQQLPIHLFDKDYFLSLESKQSLEVSRSTLPFSLTNYANSAMRQSWWHAFHLLVENRFADEWGRGKGSILVEHDHALLARLRDRIRCQEPPIQIETPNAKPREQFPQHSETESSGTTEFEQDQQPQPESLSQQIDELYKELGDLTVSQAASKRTKKIVQEKLSLLRILQERESLEIEHCFKQSLSLPLGKATSLFEQSDEMIRRYANSGQENQTPHS